MDERGKGRGRTTAGGFTQGASRESRHSTQSASNTQSSRRYRDSFFEDMLVSEAGAEEERGGVSSSSRSDKRQTEPEQAGRKTARTASREGSAAKKALKVAGAIAAVFVLVVIGAAFAYVGSISANLHSGLDDDLSDVLVETDMTNEPFYMLLLGTDGSVERDDDPEYAGVFRSDSMMLVRVDAAQKKITLISIPRDIPIDFGGDIGKQKINAAYAIGGPSLAVKAVSELAGVDISHYAQVDIDGFASIVDALGGVEVDVPVYINDYEAGGVLQPGLQTLDGSQALILCRSRNTYGNNGDHMRAANQRQVLMAIAKKALNSDVRTIAYTVQAMSQYVTTDLELADIVGLAEAMSGMDTTTNMYTASVPTESRYVDDGWYEFVDKERWNEMMERVRAGEPPTEETEVDAATGVVLSTAGTGAGTDGLAYCSITVKNATDEEDLEDTIGQALVEAGYVNVAMGTVNDSFSYPDTLVVYNDPNREAEAQDILDVVGQGKLHYDKAGEYAMFDIDFLVVLGEDWES